MNLVGLLASALRRKLFGISAEEIRDELAGVHREIASVRTEMEREIAKLRREIDALPRGDDRPRGPEIPVGEA